MTIFQRITTYLFISFISVAAVAKNLPSDIEPGDGINEIQLPLNKKSAAELVRIETKGKILSVDEAKQNGIKIFKVKVLHSTGKVKNHIVDSRTGHSLK